MSVQLAQVELGPATWLGRLNTSRHQVATYLFTAVVLAHWAEHLVQAVQIWALGWPRPEALGLLGLAMPSLISEEWLHWAYAVVMLVGFVVLLPGMTGRARLWWKVALWIQVWHWVEHLLLFVQAQLDLSFFGASGPTSIAQLVVPRVELHLFLQRDRHRPDGHRDDRAPLAEARRSCRRLQLRPALAEAAACAAW